MSYFSNADYERHRRLAELNRRFPLSSEIFHPPKSSKPEVEVRELETDLKPPYRLSTEVNITKLTFPEFAKLIEQENTVCELYPQYIAHGYWWTLHSCENHPAVILKWVKNDM